MNFSVYDQKANALVLELHDEATSRAFETYRRHEEQPGPVIAFVGASGRGKSSLWASVSGGEPAEPGTQAVLFHDLRWNQPAYHLLRQPVIHQVAATGSGRPGAASSLLFADARAFAPGGAAEEVMARADVAIFAVQVTQPTGADEVAWARKHLAGTDGAAPVLVLTKADQADEDDLAEAAEAILKAYGDLPWQAVLIAGRDVPDEGRGGFRRFDQWWREAGADLAENARAARLDGLRRAWQASARAALDFQEAAREPELLAIQAQLRADEGVRRALDLRARIRSQINVLPRRAADAYSRGLSALRADLSECVEPALARIRSTGEQDNAALEREIQTSLATGDEQARAQVRQEVQPLVDSLRADCEAFIQTVGALCSPAAAAQRPDASSGWNEDLISSGTVFHVPEVGLSFAREARPLLAAVPSGLGSALGLYTAAGLVFLPAIIAAPVALAAGALIGGSLYATQRDDNQSRLAGEMRTAITKRLEHLLRDLQTRFVGDWQALADEITGQIDPYDRTLNIHLATQRQDDPDARDTAAARSRLVELLDEKRRLARLRAALNALDGRHSSQHVARSSQEEKANV